MYVCGAVVDQPLAPKTDACACEVMQGLKHDADTLELKGDVEGAKLLQVGITEMLWDMSTVDMDAKVLPLAASLFLCSLDA